LNTSCHMGRVGSGLSPVLVIYTKTSMSYKLRQ
jgi:hypothetical protein